MQTLHRLHFMQYFTVWGVEPVVTHQTSWLESTGECGVRLGRRRSAAKVSSMQSFTLSGAFSCTMTVSCQLQVANSLV